MCSIPTWMLQLPRTSSSVARRFGLAGRQDPPLVPSGPPLRSMMKSSGLGSERKSPAPSLGRRPGHPSPQAARPRLSVALGGKSRQSVHALYLPPTHSRNHITTFRVSHSAANMTGTGRRSLGPRLFTNSRPDDFTELSGRARWKALGGHNVNKPR